VCELDARIQLLARSRGLELVVPEDRWYGFDPIHFRQSVRATAWRTFLETLLPADVPVMHRERSAAAWRLAPEERRIFGFLQRRTQPSLAVRNLHFSLY
jgi:hypothetical protein